MTVKEPKLVKKILLIAAVYLVFGSLVRYLFDHNSKLPDWVLLLLSLAQLVALVYLIKLFYEWIKSERTKGT
jgi:hypothetical protein